MEGETMNTPHAGLGQHMSEQLKDAPERRAVTNLASFFDTSQVAPVVADVAPTDQLTERMRQVGLFPDHIAIVQHFLKEELSSVTDVRAYPDEQNPDGASSESSR
jgi:hypothetical protein